jgi:hypothetical protein
MHLSRTASSPGSIYPVAASARRPAKRKWRLVVDLTASQVNAICSGHHRHLPGRRDGFRNTISRRVLDALGLVMGVVVEGFGWD